MGGVIKKVGVCEWQDCRYYGRERDNDLVLCGIHENMDADMPDWNYDYVTVMADGLLGFNDYPEWYQDEVWEVRECSAASIRRAIRDAAGLDDG